jgi:hypothetical protein
MVRAPRPTPNMKGQGISLCQALVHTCLAYVTVPAARQPPRLWSSVVHASSLIRLNMPSERWKVETTSRGVGYIRHLNCKCLLYHVTCNYFYITRMYWGNMNTAVREIVRGREVLQVRSLWQRLVTTQCIRVRLRVYCTCCLIVVTVHALHNYLTPWSKIRLEICGFAQVFKKFSVFFENRRFITVVTRARHISLSYSTQFKIHFNIILL